MKAHLRSFFKQVLKKRKNISQKSFKKTLNLFLDQYLKKDSFIGSYRSFKDEINPQINSKKYQVFLCSQENEKIAYFRKNQKIKKSKLKAVIVPGLLFNHNLERLGRGAGRFDSFLKKFSGLKIGFCHSSQITNKKLKLEDHDQNVDALVCEKYVLRNLRSIK